MTLFVACFFIVIAILSTVIERRQFRNGVFLAIGLFYLWCYLVETGNANIALIIVIIIPIMMIILAFFLIHNGVTMLKKEGKSLQNSLSLLTGILVIAIACFDFYLLFVSQFEGTGLTYQIIFGSFLLINGIFAYLSLTFFIFLFNNVVYTILPVRRKCDYIIIHGAGLLHGNEVSPLLKGRCNKGIELYNKAKNKPKIIVSGGQGHDETTTEAAAMAEYVLSCGINKDDIILEDKSTTTLENLKNCKEIILKEHPNKKYRAIFVTNDYHLFRTGIYAKRVRLKAAGVGCKTASYYWPSAMIREFIAIFVLHKYMFIVYLILLIIFTVLYVKN